MGNDPHNESTDEASAHARDGDFSDKTIWAQRRELARERRRQRTRRFVDRYEKRRAIQQEKRRSFLVRPLRIALGVLLIFLAPLVGWVPGPGGMLVLIPGVFLLASEVRRAAIIMDRIENVTIPKLQQFLAKHRKGPKPEWVMQDPIGWAQWCTDNDRELPDTSHLDGDGIEDDEVSQSSSQ